MKVELSKFRVKADKSEKVNEWMELLNQHMDQVLLTLLRSNVMVVKRKIHFYLFLTENGFVQNVEPNMTVTLMQRRTLKKKEFAFYEHLY